MGRKRRVAKGSGTSVAEVNDLLKQFHQMRTLMKKQKGAGLGGMIGRMAQRIVPGLGGAAKEKDAMMDKLYGSGQLDPAAGARTKVDSRRKREQRKAERKRRKKGRKR